MILQGARFDDAGAIENGSLLATLPLRDIESEVYEAIRIQFTEGGTAAALIAVTHILFDAQENPKGQVDETFPLLRP